MKGSIEYMETCETCRNYIDTYYIILPLFIDSVTFNTSDGQASFIRTEYCEKNNDGTGICDCEFSEMYKCGVNNGGYCEYYMKKQKDKEKKYDFSVFNNYKCDGQLVMKFNGTDIEIKEEEKETIYSIQKRI